MRRTQRQVSDEERRGAKRGLSLLDWRARRLATLDAAGTVADVYEFQVQRAWLLITCSGPPCCPNHWFLDLGEGEFVELWSWDHLRAAEGAFPGREVQLAVWPRTRRIVAVSCRGDLVEAHSLPPEAETGLNGPPDSAELRFWNRGELTAELRAQMDAA